MIRTGQHPLIILKPDDVRPPGDIAIQHALDALGIVPGAYILSVGRLVPDKGWDIALDGIHWYIEGVATLGALGNEISHAETAIFVHGFD